MKTPRSFPRLGIAFLALFAVIAFGSARAEDARPVVDDSKATPVPIANPNLPTIFVVGDSTANSSGTSPLGRTLRGWGSELGAFFDPAKINVINRAIGGRSSRTYITEGRWDRVLGEMKSGDFVLVQFGHNDGGNYLDPKAKGRPSLPGEGEDTAQAVKSDGVTMETIHSYGWYMRKYGADAKAKGVHVIYLSMVPHKIWIGTTIRLKEQDSYVKWTRDAADTNGEQFIDTNKIIATGFEKLGQPKVEDFFADQNTHATFEGAKYNASAVVVGLKSLNPDPLANYFSPAADNLPPTLTGSAAN